MKEKHKNCHGVISLGLALEPPCPRCTQIHERGVPEIDTQSPDLVDFISKLCAVAGKARWFLKDESIHGTTPRGRDVTPLSIVYGGKDGYAAAMKKGSMTSVVVRLIAHCSTIDTQMEKYKPVRLVLLRAVGL